jgi:hypothetical protein
MIIELNYVLHYDIRWLGVFYRYCNWIGNKLHDQALPSAVHSCSVVRSYPTFMLNRMSITVNTKSAIRSYPEALQSTLHLLMYHQSTSYKGYSPDEGSTHLWNVVLREYTTQYPKRLSPLYSRLRIWSHLRLFLWSLPSFQISQPKFCMNLLPSCVLHVTTISYYVKSTMWDF